MKVVSLGFLTKWRRNRRIERYKALFKKAFISIDGLDDIAEIEKCKVVMNALHTLLARMLEDKLVKNVKVVKTEIKQAFNSRNKKFMKCVSMEVECDYSCCYRLSFTMTNRTGRWMVHFIKNKEGELAYSKSFTFQDFYHLDRLP